MSIILPRSLEVEGRLRIIILHCDFTRDASASTKAGDKISQSINKSINKNPASST